MQPFQGLKDRRGYGRGAGELDFDDPVASAATLALSLVLDPCFRKAAPHVWHVADPVKRAARTALALLQSRLDCINADAFERPDPALSFLSIGRVELRFEAARYVLNRSAARTARRSPFSASSCD